MLLFNLIGNLPPIIPDNTDFTSGFGFFVILLLLIAFYRRKKTQENQGVSTSEPFFFENHDLLLQEKREISEQ